MGYEKVRNFYAVPLKEKHFLNSPRNGPRFVDDLHYDIQNWMTDRRMHPVMDGGRILFETEEQAFEFKMRWC